MAEKIGKRSTVTSQPSSALSSPPPSSPRAGMLPMTSLYPSQIAFTVASKNVSPSSFPTTSYCVAEALAEEAGEEEEEEEEEDEDEEEGR